uniref:Pyrin n=1 Tax=Catagonus wagneri TaxID=51154 RepID=A0A8C3W2C3_9CETA
MAKTPSDHLLYSLEELVPYDFEKFKFKLQNTSLEKEHSRIPRGQLQTAQPVKLATLLVNHYGEDYAVQLTLQVLRAINQHLLAEELRRAISPGKRPHAPSSPRDFSTAMSSGRLQKEAVCPLCRTQEGDPVGGSCAHNPCSSSAAPEADPEASHGRPPSCRWCQDLFPGKSCGSHEQQDGLQMGSLSPNSLPQCERHTKQVQLLFCEDHGEPICLICGLSQAHRGHRVRPIGEAAREYKEKIQKQLEHLKELRKSGEKQRSQGPKKTANFLKQAETQKQKVHCQLQQLCQFLEQQEQLFGTWLDELGQIADHVRKTYGTQVTRDIASLDELIGELEAKQCQPEWELMKVTNNPSFVSRAKMVTVPELRATPPEVKEKIHLLYQKSEFVEKSMKHFLETLRSEMETFNGILILSAVDVILEAETAHPSLIFHLFLSSFHYWEVKVGDKTGWLLGVCKASTSRKEHMTLSPENDYCGETTMMMHNERQASTVPGTQARSPRRLGIFLDHKDGDVSSHDVRAKLYIYTFTGFFPLGSFNLSSASRHMMERRTGHLNICPVGGKGLTECPTLCLSLQPPGLVS